MQRDRRGRARRRPGASTWPRSSSGSRRSGWATPSRRCSCPARCSPTRGRWGRAGTSRSRSPRAAPGRAAWRSAAAAGCRRRRARRSTPPCGSRSTATTARSSRGWCSATPSRRARRAIELLGGRPFETRRAGRARARPGGPGPRARRPFVEDLRGIADGLGVAGRPRRPRRARRRDRRAARRPRGRRRPGARGRRARRAARRARCAAASAASRSRVGRRSSPTPRSRPPTRTSSRSTRPRTRTCARSPSTCRARAGSTSRGASRRSTWPAACWPGSSTSASRWPTSTARSAPRRLRSPRWPATRSPPRPRSQRSPATRSPRCSAAPARSRGPARSRAGCSACSPSSASSCSTRRPSRSPRRRRPAVPSSSARRRSAPTPPACRRARPPGVEPYGRAGERRRAGRRGRLSAPRVPVRTPDLTRAHGRNMDTGIGRARECPVGRAGGDRYARIAWPCGARRSGGGARARRARLGGGVTRWTAGRACRTATCARRSCARRRRSRAGRESLGTQVAWNQFGTPSSLVDPGGTLATGVAGATPEAAARAWLGAEPRRCPAGSPPTASSSWPTRARRRRRPRRHAAPDRRRPARLRRRAASPSASQRDGAAGRSSRPPARSAATRRWPARPRSRRSRPCSARPPTWASARSLGQIEPRRQVRRRAIKAFASPASSDRAAHARGGVPDRRRGFVPAYETIVLDTEGAEPAAYRMFVDARDGAVLARESLVDSAADEPLAAALAAPVAFTGELPATDGGCGPQHGPVHRRRRAPACARSTCSPTPTRRRNDIVLRLYRGTTLVGRGRHGHHARAASATRPPAACPPGDYFVAGLRVPRTARRRSSRARTPARSRSTTSAAARAVHARAGARSGQPAAAARSRATRGTTRAPTSRENVVLEAEHDRVADCDDVVGNLASRVAVGPRRRRPNAPTNTTRGQQRPHGRVLDEPGRARREPVPADQRARATTRSRGRTRGTRSDCNPGTPYGAAFVSAELRHLGGGRRTCSRMHNRMHDWSYLLGFTEENWNAQAVELRPDRGVPRERPGARRRAGRRARRRRPPATSGAQQREHAHAARRRRRRSRTCTCGSRSRARSTPPCVDGDFDAGVIGHEYGHMIENRMIGKGGRRTGHHAGAMGESIGDLIAIEQLNEYGLVPDRRREPVRDRHLRDRQQAARHPQLRARTARPPARSRRRASTPQVDPLNFSDIGYDLTGPAGPRRRRDLDGDRTSTLRKALAAKYNGQYPASDHGAAEAVRRRPGRRSTSARATGAGSSSCSTRSC